MRQSTHTLTVLVVEDSEILGMLLARLLAEEPNMQHVGTVTTAQTAIDAIVAAGEGAGVPMSRSWIYFLDPGMVSRS